MGTKIFTKPYLIGASVVVAGVVVYLIINRANKKKLIAKINDVLDGNVQTSKNDLTTEQIEKLAELKFPLKLGASGRQVANIQKALNAKAGAGLVVDGRMGQDTMEALCKYYFSVCVPSWMPKSMWREVTQSDYNNIVNKSKDSWFEGSPADNIVESGSRKDIMNYANS